MAFTLCLGMPKPSAVLGAVGGVGARRCECPTCAHARANTRTHTYILSESSRMRWEGGKPEAARSMMRARGASHARWWRARRRCERGASATVSHRGAVTWMIFLLASATNHSSLGSWGATAWLWLNNFLRHCFAVVDSVYSR